MVTGDGYGHREFRRQPFGHRQLAPGHWRLKAERLTPGRLTTVAVTRHPECIPYSGRDRRDMGSDTFSIPNEVRPRRVSPRD